MPNLDRPRGFLPYGGVKSANPYEAGSTVYPGDLVSLANDGAVDPVAAGSTILGAALNYATAGQTVMVCDDPEQRYLAQADEAELDAQTDIGNNCDHLATAGDSTYKQSRMEVDSSTVAASAAGLTILAINARPGNAGGANCEVVVRINEHQLKDAFAGI